MILFSNLLNILLAILFFLSFYFKLLDFKNFKYSIMSYKIVPLSLVSLSAVIVLAIELLLVISFTVHLFILWANIIGLLLLLFFNLLLLFKRNQQQANTCTCFGKLDFLNKNPLIRNTIFIFLIVINLFTSKIEIVPYISLVLSIMILIIALDMLAKLKQGLRGG